MIALLGRALLRRPQPADALAEMRGRVARMRREVAAMQQEADVLYGQPEEQSCPWRDPEAVARG